MKVLAACGSGMGSSQIIKMKLTNVFRKLNIPLEVHHCAVSEAKSSAKNYDLVVISSALDLPNTKIVGLQNLLSEKEMTEKISEALGL